MQVKLSAAPYNRSSHDCRRNGSNRWGISRRRLQRARAASHQHRDKARPTMGGPRVSAAGAVRRCPARSTVNDRSRWRSFTGRASSSRNCDREPGGLPVRDRRLARRHDDDRRPLPLPHRSSRTSISTCTPRARSTRPGTPSARISRRSTASRACASPCGRRMPRSSPWPAISTIGTRAAIPCGCATAASGRSSCPARRRADSYKYQRALALRGYQQLKADPYAFRSEVPPKSASVVCDLDSYQWQRRRVDGGARRNADWLKDAGLDLRSASGILDARPDGASR